jgi:glycosyltransferase involved in cell wall biosynthesis
MNKLLTIAIPTYNRAELLDKQLTWLSQAIKGFETECEILVSDNCSTDHTQSIISKWQNILKNITFKSNKNPENIGVMRNIFYCLSSATTKYIWTIGDDDPIQERAVTYVMDKIKNIDDLSLLFLNFYGLNQSHGE